MGEISVPFVFSSGTTIVASEHNSNNSTVYGEVNGELENVNIKANAGIVGSKLNLSAAGIIGATTPAAGTFTVLNATSVGATTPGSGIFTALEAETTLKLGTTNQGDILYDNGTSLVRLTPGTSGKYLQTKGTAANPIWETVVTANTSNTVFAWSAAETSDSSSSGRGFNVGDGTEPVSATNAVSSGVIWTADTAYWTFQYFRFKKIAGIDTVTIEARVKSSDGITGTVNVSIGSQVNTVTQTATSFGWVTASDIDVSSLTDGTTYDGFIQIKSSSNDETSDVWCSAITLIGS